jgi:hypothetical protein
MSQIYNVTNQPMGKTDFFCDPIWKQVKAVTFIIESNLQNYYFIVLWAIKRMKIQSKFEQQPHYHYNLA